jgi:predicted 3-demethylubiquinone-9 3-methyltransferase (glyoxalase superfamily)
MAKNLICLWYDGTAEDAARFYAQTFPDYSISIRAFRAVEGTYRYARDVITTTIAISKEVL